MDNDDDDVPRRLEAVAGGSLDCWCSMFRAACQSIGLMRGTMMFSSPAKHQKIRLHFHGQTDSPNVGVVIIKTREAAVAIEMGQAALAIVIGEVTVSIEIG